MSRLESCEQKLASTYSDESQSGVAHSGGHPSYLSIFPLGKFKADPSVGHALTDPNRRDSRGYRCRGIEQAGAAGAGRLAIQDNTTGGESNESFGFGAAFNLNPIFAAMAVARVQ